MKRGRYDDDDGHTVASMSALRQEPEDVSPSTRHVREELQDKEAQRMVILGTMKAALGLAMVYVIVFGIAIAIMLWLWT